MKSVKTYDELLDSLTKEKFIECYERFLGKSKEESKELFKEYGLDVDSGLIDELIDRFKGVEAIQLEELDSVAGGTCYRNGFDGQYRPVVMVGNECDLFVPQFERSRGIAPKCERCKYYSYNVNGVRISLVSAYCTHDSRIKGHDHIHGEQ